VCRVYTGANVAVQMEIMYKLLYAGIDVNVKDHAGMFNKQGLVIYVCVLHQSTCNEKSNFIVKFNCCFFKFIL